MKELEESVRNHPKLDYISIKANGATSNMNKPPTTLYRKQNGSLWVAKWSHFRPTD